MPESEGVVEFVVVVNIELGSILQNYVEFDLSSAQDPYLKTHDLKDRLVTMRAKNIALLTTC